MRLGRRARDGAGVPAHEYDAFSCEQVPHVVAAVEHALLGVASSLSRGGGETPLDLHDSPSFVLGQLIGVQVVDPGVRHPKKSIDRPIGVSRSWSAARSWNMAGLAEDWSARELDARFDDRGSENEIAHLAVLVRLWAGVRLSAVRLSSRETCAQTVVVTSIVLCPRIC